MSSGGEAYDIKTTFLYPINYNWMLNGMVMGQWFLCTMVGNWGLFWYNDGGEMWEECFGVGLEGATVTFPTM